MRRAADSRILNPTSARSISFPDRPSVLLVLEEILIHLSTLGFLPTQLLSQTRIQVFKVRLMVRTYSNL